MRLPETPSSVTITPAAELHATGHRALGDALRRVRGASVTCDRNHTFVGVRELQRPATTTTRACSRSTDTP